MHKKFSLRYILNISLITIFSIVFVLVLSIVVLTNLWAKSMVHPNRISPTGFSLEEQKIPFENIKLITRDGVQLSAWYTPPKNGAVILLAHGYGDNRPESLYAIFAKNGYGVLAWDFRAHGDSEGDFTSLGYYEQLDVEAALDFALSQEGVETVGAWGGSMGAATILITAAERSEIKAVIADS